MEYVTLNNGVKMSILGYGVYQVTKEGAAYGVNISLGRRCIDSRFVIGRWKQLSDWQIWQNATEVFV